MNKDLDMEMVIDGLEEIEMENTAIDDLESENVNLMFLGIDQSGSMSSYTHDMKTSLANFKSALTNSKEADEILVARADFNSRIDIGGYKKIDEFNTDFSAHGMTSLYDVIVDGTNKLQEYKTFLKEQGVRVKAVMAIFSDGEDTSSQNGFSNAKRCIEELNNAEVTTAFISFGSASLQIAKDLGFKNILDVQSSESELRNAFDCLSKSVIESSKTVLPDGDDFFQF